jgi:hypothetical protein
MGVWQQRTKIDVSVAGSCEPGGDKRVGCSIGQTEKLTNKRTT